MMLNPIIRREIKTSLRSWKMFLAIALYTLVVSGAAIIFINAITSGVYSTMNLRELSILYAVLGFMQFGMTMILIPALTAGSISGERERQTLDILLVTKMKPLSIIWGKMVSSIGIFILMMISTLPVFAITFFWGGLSFVNVIIMEVYMIIISAMAGSIAIFFSTFFKKTVASMVLTYMVLGILCFGTLIISFIYIAYYNSIYMQAPSVTTIFMINIANPGVGFATLMDKQLGTDIVMSFFGYWQDKNNILEFFCKYFWIINMFVNIIITFLFMLLASLRLRKTNE